MPIIPREPWRQQYFDGIDCPNDAVIPIGNGYAYEMFPEHRWIYNKLLIAESQEIRCAPHGLAPPHFPVFPEPIYNMRGMGTGSRVLRSLEQWHRRQAPGHMWMELLDWIRVSWLFLDVRSHGPHTGVCMFNWADEVKSSVDQKAKVA